MTGRVVLGKSGVLQLATGHPWIGPRHIASNEGVRDGELVALEGPPGVPRGFAVFSGASAIPLRVVSRQPSFEVEGWWARRLDAALARRDQIAPGVDACRLVHAEADGLPGLVVDRYGEIAVLQAGCLWADTTAHELAGRLVERHGFAGVLARHDGSFRRPEGLTEEVRVLAGDVPQDEVEIHVGALRRRVDVHAGQKTGAYLDQRTNQQWAVTALPEGRVLDAFSNDGGFALQLALAGRVVDAVDSSQPALARAVSVAEEHGVAERLHTVRANVFEHLRALVVAGERYDGIVLDPPALAKKKHDVSSALRAYKDLNLRALRALRPGGRLVTCSCSYHVDAATFLDVVGQAAADARVDVHVLETRGAAACHPHLVTFPESAYLKVLLLEVVG
ncbi:MAG: class I SAM-dependent rRNA methyltransferase [Planctomycetes bacterium]|nr:class I SAM-dependent rRNA methyltransferase [Planctomycetota bacterium]